MFSLTPSPQQNCPLFFGGGHVGGMEVVTFCVVFSLKKHPMVVDAHSQSAHIMPNMKGMTCHGV